jgi:mRNA interferase RelE/StbE
LGKALTGGKIKLWRYRTGAFRVVCQIDDVEKIVRVLRVGHRKDVYR